MRTGGACSHLRTNIDVLGPGWSRLFGSCTISDGTIVGLSDIRASSLIEICTPRTKKSDFGWTEKGLKNLDICSEANKHIPLLLPPSPSTCLTFANNSPMCCAFSFTQEYQQAYSFQTHFGLASYVMLGGSHHAPAVDLPLYCPPPAAAMAKAL
jgi:hypothetical protein